MVHYHSSLNDVVSYDNNAALRNSHSTKTGVADMLKSLKNSG